jgi:hypothetical protein
MSTVAEIEEAIKKLPTEEVRQLWEWFLDYLEDELTMTQAFKNEIEAGLREIEQGDCCIVGLKALPALTDDLLESGADLSCYLTNGRPASAIDFKPR